MPSSTSAAVPASSSSLSWPLAGVGVRLFGGVSSLRPLRLLAATDFTVLYGVSPSCCRERATAHTARGIQNIALDAL